MNTYNRNIYVIGASEHSDVDNLPHRTRYYSGCSQRPASVLTVGVIREFLSLCGGLKELESALKYKGHLRVMFKIK
uniref:Uncharacterized protein n=1 Tax=Syphacia muris TaxID=451379 RepID=A0A0N5B0A4_9BILA